MHVRSTKYVDQINLIFHWVFQLSQIIGPEGSSLLLLLLALFFLSIINTKQINTKLFRFDSLVLVVVVVYFRALDT